MKNSKKEKLKTWFSSSFYLPAARANAIAAAAVAQLQQQTRKSTGTETFLNHTKSWENVIAVAIVSVNTKQCN